MFHPPREDRRSRLWPSSSSTSTSTPYYPPLVDIPYRDQLQKYRASSLLWGERERGQRSELHYRQHHPILSTIAYSVAKSWATTGFVAVSAPRRRRRISGRSGWIPMDVEPNDPYGHWACDSYGRHRHSRFLQAYSRQCRFKRGRRRCIQVGEGPAWRSVRRYQSLRVRLMTLESRDRDRQDRWYRW